MGTRAHNFSAGPAALPLPVLQRIREDLPDFRQSGFSILESSHRWELYEAAHAAAAEGICKLLAVPQTHQVLFLAGGATMQFGMTALNFLPDGGAAGFADTGAWAKKAIEDARTLGSAVVVYDGKSTGYTRMPSREELELTVQERTDLAYLHLTSNETINGSQLAEFPAVSIPVIVDMSSDIMSRPLPWDRIDLAYGGAQKNLGPAGVTVVIVRRSLAAASVRPLPAYLRYDTHADKQSLYNTPPVFAIYALGLVLDWVREEGGLPEMERRNRSKADLVYGAIAASDGFYTCPVEPGSRSVMNAVFTLPDDALTKAFLAGAQARGLLGLGGHRSVGGCRASLYNAVPLESAEALVSWMQEFRRAN